MADPRIPTGPIERDPGGYLPTPIQRALLDAALDRVELGAHDRRILDWLAGWDTSTVVPIVSLIERAKAAALADQQVDSLLGRDRGCPSCTCCSHAGCHPGAGSECPYSPALDRIVCPCTEE
jgi:hypothetical protein